MVYDFFKILFLILMLTMPKLTALAAAGIVYAILY